MRVCSHLKEATQLTAMEIQRMLELMQRHYHGVTEDSFLQDLQGKDWVILLHDQAREVVGFSTQKQFTHSVHGRSCTIVFSGDTIIDKAYWGTLALPIAFVRMMLDIQQRSSQQDLYWFLISKGYRTYRYLPVFFHRFYPRCGTAIPAFERDLLHGLGERMFPQRYDSQAGIIRTDGQGQRLRQELGEVTPSRLKNGDVAFFVQANPRHAQGDELACLAPFDQNNLTDFLLKRVYSCTPY